MNVGVAAHITAASSGGPRYAPELSDQQRKCAANGIWLCQTCAKLVDSDEERFSVSLLKKWKCSAETDALKRIGKTNLARSSSARSVEQALKRDHRIRDEIRAAFLKDSKERMAERPFGAQYNKFKETEFIVRRLDDVLYPNFNSAPGISNWFKLETFDFYFNGIEGILGIEYVLATEFTRSWSLLPDQLAKGTFPDGFWPVKVFKIGRIPWRNIRHHDLDGDEYYPFPHLYCLFADDGMPYESFVYYSIADNNGYHRPFPLDGMVDMKRLLEVDPTTQVAWELLL